MSKFFYVLALGLTLLSCAKKTGTDDEAEEAVSTGIGAMSAAVIAENSSASISREVTTCGSPAFGDTCDVATKTRKATYTDCAIGASSLKYSGSVTLTYNRAACSMAVPDSTVTRTIELARDGLAGSTVNTSSSTHTDYRGTSIGGGSVITKTSDGRTLAINGIHKVKTTSAGKKAFDISFRTTTAFELTNVSENSLTVASGTMEVIHNLAEYTATFSSKDLVYDSSTCCYPTSGTISVTYDGSVTGTGSVSFGECGTVTFTRNSVEKTVTLAGCE